MAELILLRLIQLRKINIHEVDYLLRRLYRSVMRLIKKLQLN